MSAAARALAFVLPGSLQARTGGTRYDRRIVHGLRAQGWEVQLVSLSERFPWPQAEDLAAADAALAVLGDGSLVVADGLCFGALPAVVQRHAQRLRWVALVHHPLALESGLDAAQRDHLRASERAALAWARGVIVTSASTAQDLTAYGVAREHIAVVEPGTDPPAPRPPRPAGPPTLLCVATLTPRKGHLALLQALAPLRHLPWSLHCVGSTTRDPATARAVQDTVASLQLQDRVRLHGEVGEDALAAHYAAADVFVLASEHEGYGMALAEALAHGLPIVSTSAGAIAHTVPADAAVLVPPGDGPALQAALARLVSEPALRERLAARAREAAARLPGWPAAVDAFAAALQRWSMA